MLGLAGLAIAADSPGSTCSSTIYITETTTATAPASPSSEYRYLPSEQGFYADANGRFVTASAVVKVATDSSSGQFTAIGDAIVYAQQNQIPTVTISAGIYPAVTVSATPSVTLLAETEDENNYAQNQVAISNDGSALKISADTAGFTVKNIDFVNTASSGGVVVVRGNKLGFYQYPIHLVRPSGHQGRGRRRRHCEQLHRSSRPFDLGHR